MKNSEQSLLFPEERNAESGSNEKKALQAIKIKKETRKLRRSIVREYKIEDKGGLEVLDRAMESFARMREAGLIIAEEGLVTLNRFGEKKEHPAASLERKSRTQFLACLKQLGLDMEIIGK